MKPTLPLTAPEVSGTAASAANKAPLRDLLHVLSAELDIFPLSQREETLIRLAIEAALGAKVENVSAVLECRRSQPYPELRHRSFEIMRRMDASSRELLKLDMALSVLKTRTSRINRICDIYITALELLRPQFLA